MHLVCLLSALLCLSHVHRDPFAWLYGWHSQRYYSDSLQAAKGGECPDKCDCPPSFPVAMYCDGCSLTAMPAIPSHVKYLYLQNNAITSVSDSALSNATSLVYIPPNLPRSLRDLRLNHNKIEKATPADLEGMDNLTILYLHDNAVTDMSISLKALKSLTLLDASSNKLTKVPKELPEHLHQLYLESNSIDFLPEDFLHCCTLLQYIRMAHNQLTDKGLDLSYNKLERIPPVSTTLELLYLHTNQIKEFTLGSFCSFADVTNFSKLRTLRLEGNEISRQDIPSESSLCLHQASSIDIGMCA
uniref:Fibromodulin n=1 Tax=Monopterus albus TaxID=43700 RepID=A0A3Q3K6R7_MONAL